MSDTPDTTEIVVPYPETAITQIAVSSGDPDYLYALTAAGAVWRLSIKLGYGWFKLWPQDEPPAGRSTPSTPI